MIKNEDIKKRLPNSYIQWIDANNVNDKLIINGITILSYDRLIKANMEILGEEIVDSISNEWYVVAKDSSDECIIMDLSDRKKGYIYNGFWETYGLVGDMPIIAKSFDEFVCQIKSNGEYWLSETFEKIGDAFD